MISIPQVSLFSEKSNLHITAKVSIENPNKPEKQRITLIVRNLTGRTIESMSLAFSPLSQDLVKIPETVAISRRIDETVEPQHKVVLSIEKAFSEEPYALEVKLEYILYELGEIDRFKENPMVLTLPIMKSFPQDDINTGLDTYLEDLSLRRIPLYFFHQYNTAHWACAYCGTLNSPENTECMYCKESIELQQKCTQQLVELPNPENESKDYNTSHEHKEEREDMNTHTPPPQSQDKIIGNASSQTPDTPSIPYVAHPHRSKNRNILMVLITLSAIIGIAVVFSEQQISEKQTTPTIKDDSLGSGERMNITENIAKESIAAIQHDSETTSHVTSTRKSSISFDRNGGEGMIPDPIVLDKGEIHFFPSADTLKKDNARFIGWGVSPSQAINLSTVGDTLDTYETKVYYAQWKSIFSEGDIGPADGTIICDKGYVSDGWRYIEAAPVETMWSDVAWMTSASAFFNLDSELGTGKENCKQLISKTGMLTVKSLKLPYAILLADNLDYNGYDDWFIPSIDELKLIYSDSNIFLNMEGLFWSSSDMNSTTVWGLDVSNATIRELSKSEKFSALAIRYF